VKVVARLRTPDGKVVRMGIEATPSGAALATRATPPPLELFARPAPPAGKDGTARRGPWWLLRALRESYQRYF
jgi:hypothetical protein